MDIIIIVLAMFFVILVPVAIVADKIGEHMEQWLENHFPDIEE